MLSPMPEMAAPKYTLFPLLAVRNDDTNAKFTIPAGIVGVTYTFAKDVVVSVELDMLIVKDDGNAETMILLVDMDVKVDDDRTNAVEAPLLICMDCIVDEITDSVTAFVLASIRTILDGAEHPESV
jgi:hypothetical protein